MGTANEYPEKIPKYKIRKLKLKNSEEIEACKNYTRLGTALNKSDPHDKKYKIQNYLRIPEG